MNRTTEQPTKSVVSNHGRPALIITLVIAVLLPLGRTHADAVTVVPTTTLERTRSFGEVQFVIGEGPNPRLRGAGPWWLEMNVGGQPVASVPWFKVSDVQGSPDGMYFIALSNSGYTRLAFVVLDSTGQMLFLGKHDADGLRYCERSVTTVRRWVDARSSQVTFRVSGPPDRHLEAVIVRGCDGGPIELTPNGATYETSSGAAP